MLRKNNILYGKNIDITSYSEGKRETLNSVSLGSISCHVLIYLLLFHLILNFTDRLDVPKLLLSGTTIAMAVVYAC